VAGLNILVAGGTQAEEETFLNCLSSAIPSRERVVTCEEVFELTKLPLLQMSAWAFAMSGRVLTQRLSSADLSASADPHAGTRRPGRSARVPVCWTGQLPPAV